MYTLILFFSIYHKATIIIYTLINNKNSVITQCLEQGSLLYKWLKITYYIISFNLLVDILICILLILLLFHIYKLQSRKFLDIYIYIKDKLDIYNFMIYYSNIKPLIFIVILEMLLLHGYVFTIKKNLVGIYKVIKTQLSIFKANIISTGYGYSLLDVSIVSLFAILLGILSVFPLFIYVGSIILIASLSIIIYISGILVFFNKISTTLIINSVDNIKENNNKSFKEIIFMIFTPGNISTTIIIFIFMHYFNIGHFINILLFANYSGPIVIYYFAMYLYLLGFVNKKSVLTWFLTFLLKFSFYQFSGFYYFVSPNTTICKITNNHLQQATQSLLNSNEPTNSQGKPFVIGDVRDDHRLKENVLTEEKKVSVIDHLG